MTWKYTLRMAVLAAFMTLFLGCSSLLYYPKKESIYDPRKMNLIPEEIFF